MYQGCIHDFGSRGENWVNEWGGGRRPRRMHAKLGGLGAYPFPPPRKMLIFEGLDNFWRNFSSLLIMSVSIPNQIPGGGGGGAKASPHACQTRRSGGIPLPPRTFFIFWGLDHFWRNFSSLSTYHVCVHPKSNSRGGELPPSPPLNAALWTMGNINYIR